MKDSPCYNCAERYTGCHSGCAKYIEWRAEVQKQSDAINDRKNFERASKSDKSQRDYYKYLKRGRNGK